MPPLPPPPPSSHRNSPDSASSALALLLLHHISHLPQKCLSNCFFLSDPQKMVPLPLSLFFFLNQCNYLCSVQSSGLYRYRGPNVDFPQCSSIGGVLAQHAEGPGFSFQRCMYLLWWCLPVIPAFGEKGMDQRFEVILCFVVLSSLPVWDA